MSELRLLPERQCRLYAATDRSYISRHGSSRADCVEKLEQYGLPTTIYNRFNRWSYAGHWDRIMEAVADAHNVDMVIRWLMAQPTIWREKRSITTAR